MDGKTRDGERVRNYLYNPPSSSHQLLFSKRPCAGTLVLALRGESTDLQVPALSVSSAERGSFQLRDINLKLSFSWEVGGGEGVWELLSVFVEAKQDG